MRSEHLRNIGHGGSLLRLFAPAEVVHLSVTWGKGLGAPGQKA